MIKFEDELRDAAEKKDAFVVLDYLLPEVQALPVVQEFEAGTLNLPGAGAFRMQDADAEALTEAILACKLMVRRLELPNHAIGNAGAGQLAKLLTSDDDYPTQIKTLNLQGNQLGATSMLCLAKAMKQAECRLETLNLSWNPIGREGIINLLDGLITNRSLKSLYINSCDLDVVGLIHLAAYLKENTTLRLVHMDRPLVESSEAHVVERISEALKVNTTLTEVAMRKHQIRDLGAEFIANSLYLNHTLRVMDLSCNSIGLAGAEAIASALMQQQNLESLDLSHNPIGDDGAKALSALLAKNRSISRLRICFCSIGRDGLCELTSGLRSNSTLQLLRIWGNTFTQETLQLYQSLLCEHAAITGLRVDLMVYSVDGRLYAAHCKVEDHEYAAR